MIDTHCHLNETDYEDLTAVISHMGNNIMIVAGTNREENEQVLKLCSQYDNIYGTIGFHPEFASAWNEEEATYLEAQLRHPKIVGIGEIGLDYHYETDNKELQKRVFREQLFLAHKHQLPVVIHSRDAIQDTYQLLKEGHIEEIPSIMHCYSSSLEMAREFLKLNMKLGIGGVVTFKNGSKLKEIVKKLPLSSFVLETDSPYLSPEPFRGKINEPKNAVYVAEMIASLKNLSLAEVLTETTNTACSIFHISQK